MLEMKRINFLIDWDIGQKITREVENGVYTLIQNTFA